MKTLKVGSFKFDLEYESAERKQQTGYVIVRRLDNTYVGKMVASQVHDLTNELRYAKKRRAATPELLEVCKFAAGFVARHKRLDDGMNLHEQLLAVIAKAEGKDRPEDVVPVKFKKTV